MQSIHPPTSVGGLPIVGNGPPFASWDHSHGLGIKGKDIASAAALQLGPDGSYFHVTGTTTITSISKRIAGDIVVLEFDGALTFTHNSTNLILQGGVNRSTAAGDTVVLVSEGAGNWREIARGTQSPFRDALLLNYVESTDLANPLTVSANTWTTLKANQNFTVGSASHLLDVYVLCGVLVRDDSIAISAELDAAIRIQIDSSGGTVICGLNQEAAILNDLKMNMYGGAFCLGTLSAGVHTMRPQVLASANLNTGNSGFYCRASSVPNTEFLTIQIIERGGY